MIVKKIHKKNLHSSNSSDIDYWMSQSPEIRLNAVEFMRKQFYVKSPERLQRVYSIIKRK